MYYFRKKFVKDLFEHQLGWHDKGDKKILALARFFTALLGVVAILIAVLWSDIIGLLLFTYHLWAPAVILPVVVGAIYKAKSQYLTNNIFITMLAAIGFSMLYRLVLFLHTKFAINIFGDSIYALMKQFDTSVFGVAVSCVVFLLLTIWTKFKTGSEIPVQV